MNSRATFLHTISMALGRERVPEQPTPLKLPNTIQKSYYQNSTEEQLHALFLAQSKAAGTIVHGCTMPTLNDTILTAASELGEGPILVAEAPLLQQQRTVAALERVYAQVHRWSGATGRQENLSNAESAGIGIAVAQHALAETGTVMVYSHQECGRAVTLLPTTTIIIVERSRIIPRLTQSLEVLNTLEPGQLPSSVNYISGASSTADIELVRVQGVHGPVKIAYIVVE